MDDKIMIEDRKKAVAISIDELLYIRTTKQAHYLKLVTETTNYTLRGSLGDFESKYITLVRCHRQVVVNLRTIKEIDKRSRKIHFLGNTKETCPISRRVYKSLHINWRKWIYGKLG